MRLSRGNVTKASQIMLPLYPALVIPIGLAFIFQNPSRTSGPAYDIAKNVMPMPWWGAVFLTIGLVEVLAIVIGHLDRHRYEPGKSRWLYERALIVGAGVSAFWMVLILGAAVQSNLVSFSAGWWLLAAVGAHVASARSLAAEERQ